MIVVIIPHQRGVLEIVMKGDAGALRHATSPLEFQAGCHLQLAAHKLTDTIRWIARCGPYGHLSV